MFHSEESIITTIISAPMLAQIDELWEEVAAQCQPPATLLTERELIGNHNSLEINSLLSSFRLILHQEIEALLVVDQKIDDLGYQITITCDRIAIANFCELILANLAEDVRLDLQERLRQEQFSPTLSKKFLFKLLELVTEPLSFRRNEAELNKYQPIASILRDRIEQERILQQVTRQIQENLDLLVIVKMTIEQVQHLLQLDRLLIYQLNVPTQSGSPERPEIANLVTYEARASTIISSVLNFSEDDCFRKSPNCQQKYTRGFTLSIDDVSNSSLNPCLKSLMDKLGVKAKLVIPIIVKENLWGLLIAHQCSSPRQWKANEINFLQHISEYLAVAIYQYNSYQQLEQQKEILEIQIQHKAQQLTDALLAAEIAQQSKTEFLGNISHELRTPLTCIIGLSGTLLQWLKYKHQLSLDKEETYLALIQDNGRKLLQLINNILDFTEVESGKSLLKIEEISLRNLSKTVLFSSREIARSKNINLKFEAQIPEGEERFFADPERLSQILVNLVDNSIKFTPPGGEVILRIWKENNFAVFQVEDTGIGIYKEQIPLLFNKFQQLESYRTRTYTGTGLGLALTRHLVELHGGIIEVESTVGKGSIFTVYLPNSRRDRLANQEKSDQPSLNLVANRTIVIVSRDEEMATYLCELLTAAEYQVIWLMDSGDALTKIRVIQPKIVILQQPLEEASNFAHEIKSSSKGSEIKIVLIQEKIKGELSHKLPVNDIDEYLLKPLQPTILLTTINKINRKTLPE